MKPNGKITLYSKNFDKFLQNPDYKNILSKDAVDNAETVFAKDGTALKKIEVSLSSLSPLQQRFFRGYLLDADDKLNLDERIIPAEKVDKIVANLESGQPSGAQSILDKDELASYSEIDTKYQALPKNERAYYLTKARVNYLDLDGDITTTDDQIFTYMDIEQAFISDVKAYPSDYVILPILKNRKNGNVGLYVRQAGANTAPFLSLDAFTNAHKSSVEFNNTPDKLPEQWQLAKKDRLYVESEGLQETEIPSPEELKKCLRDLLKTGQVPASLIGGLADYYIDPSFFHFIESNGKLIPFLIIPKTAHRSSSAPDERMEPGPLATNSGYQLMDFGFELKQVRAFSQALRLKPDAVYVREEEGGLSIKTNSKDKKFNLDVKASTTEIKEGLKFISEALDASLFASETDDPELKKRILVHEFFKDRTPQEIEEIKKEVQALIGKIEQFEKDKERIAYEERNQQSVTGKTFIISGVVSTAIVALVGWFYAKTKFSVKDELGREEMRRKMLAQKPHDQVLEDYTVDLVEEALKGRVDIIFGRDADVQEAFARYRSKGKTNFVATAAGGAGKSALFNAMATQIAIQVYLLDLKMHGKNPADAKVKDFFRKEQIEKLKVIGDIVRAEINYNISQAKNEGEVAKFRAELKYFEDNLAKYNPEAKLIDLCVKGADELLLPMSEYEKVKPERLKEAEAKASLLAKGKKAVQGLFSKEITLPNGYKIDLKRIQFLHLFKFDMLKLVAGTSYRGELEDRVSVVGDALADDPFYNKGIVDETADNIKAGSSEGSQGIITSLKPRLAEGEVSISGAATTKDYEEKIAHDEQMSRRLPPLPLTDLDASSIKTIVVYTAVDQLAYLMKRNYKYKGVKANIEFEPGMLTEIIARAAELFKQANPDASMDLIKSLITHAYDQCNEPRWKANVTQDGKELKIRISKEFIKYFIAEKTKHPEIFSRENKIDTEIRELKTRFHFTADEIGLDEKSISHLPGESKRDYQILLDTIFKKLVAIKNEMSNEKPDRKAIKKIAQEIQRMAFNRKQNESSLSVKIRETRSELAVLEAQKKWLLQPVADNSYEFPDEIRVGEEAYLTPVTIDKDGQIELDGKVKKNALAYLEALKHQIEILQQAVQKIAGNGERKSPSFPGMDDGFKSATNWEKIPQLRKEIFELICQGKKSKGVSFDIVDVLADVLMIDFNDPKTFPADYIDLAIKPGESIENYKERITERLKSEKNVQVSAPEIPLEKIHPLKKEILDLLGNPEEAVHFNNLDQKAGESDADYEKRLTVLKKRVALLVPGLSDPDTTETVMENLEKLLITPEENSPAPVAKPADATVPPKAEVTPDPTHGEVMNEVVADGLVASAEHAAAEANPAQEDSKAEATPPAGEAEPKAAAPKPAAAVPKAAPKAPGKADPKRGSRGFVVLPVPDSWHGAAVPLVDAAVDLAKQTAEKAAAAKKHVKARVQAGVQAGTEGAHRVAVRVSQSPLATGALTGAVGTLGAQMAGNLIDGKSLLKMDWREVAHAITIGAPAGALAHETTAATGKLTVSALGMLRLNPGLTKNISIGGKFLAPGANILLMTAFSDILSDGKLDMTAAQLGETALLMQGVSFTTRAPLRIYRFFKAIRTGVRAVEAWELAAGPAGVGAMLVEEAVMAAVDMAILNFITRKQAFSARDLYRDALRNMMYQFSLVTQGGGTMEQYIVLKQGMKAIADEWSKWEKEVAPTIDAELKYGEAVAQRDKDLEALKGSEKAVQTALAPDPTGMTSTYYGAPGVFEALSFDFATRALKEGVRGLVPDFLKAPERAEFEQMKAEEKERLALRPAAPLADMTGTVVTPRRGTVWVGGLWGNDVTLEKMNPFASLLSIDPNMLFAKPKTVEYLSVNRIPELSGDPKNIQLELAAFVADQEILMLKALAEYQKSRGQ